MINRLRRKFVLVATISVAVMLLLVVAGASLFNFVDLNSKADQMLLMITENGGVLPKPSKKDKQPQHKDLPREAMFDTRYFVVYLGEDDKTLYTDTGNIYATSSQMAQEYAAQVLEKHKTTGYLDGYKYLRTMMDNTAAIIFLDVSRDIGLLTGFMYNCSIIALAALVVVAVVSYLLTPIAIKPITDSYQKQKKFITNASHEIKTPLTVIAANLDIVEMNTGDNKWITSAREQIAKLTDLVSSLVSLSRMEETEHLDKELFSISDLCEMVAESYGSIAVSQGKAFETVIGESIYYTGSEKAISQLCYIVLDNAFKYASGSGKIFFALNKRQEKIVLTVENAVEEISVGNHNEFFDRFYRGDESRNSTTCGFGIGLSLAKSIVEKHKGKISAKSPDGKVLVVEIHL